METDRQLYLSVLIGKPFDRRDEANGAHGGVSLPDAKSTRIVEHSDGFHRIVVVVERFAHTHQDNVAEAIPFRVEFAGKVDGLLNDLAAGQVPHETHLACRAKYTAHR